MKKVSGGSQYIVYGKTHYQRNKEKYIKLAKDRKYRNRKIVQDYKTEHNICVDCKQPYPPCVLDFDHVDGEKEIEISILVNSGCSVEKLLKEIKKCEIRCSNCHRIKTFKENESR